MTYDDIKNKYTTFIYDKYEIIEDKYKFKITYYFEIINLEKFNPTLEIDKKYIKNERVNKDFLNDLIFHIGLVELISYWKVCMPKNVVIKAGYLTEEQKNWFKKLYYYGLGEFLYKNNIDVSLEVFMNIQVHHDKTTYNVDYKGKGALIPIGGGKDSIVTLNLLKGEFKSNDAFIINPKKVHLECASVAGYENKTVIVKRTIDKRLIELNNKGFLNGHTPFSALVSFITLLSAYLTNKEYIVLSNESSANESNVKGTKVNHQYSKSFEYERDFNNYVKTYFKVNIKYFSLLRCLNEYQIAYLFSKYKEFHKVFKSCNVGSKGENWIWCCNCPKCLFVYIILSPFLTTEELISIFGENLYDKKELLETFLELTGSSNHKPFECVGTYEEVNYALSRCIEKTNSELPYLLKYYKEHFKLMSEKNTLNRFNDENNIPNNYLKLVKEAIK